MIQAVWSVGCFPGGDEFSPRHSTYSKLGLGLLARWFYDKCLVQWQYSAGAVNVCEGAGTIPCGKTCTMRRERQRTEPMTSPAGSRRCVLKLEQQHGLFLTVWVQKGNRRIEALVEAENVSRQRHIITSQLYKSNCFVLANVAAADYTMSVMSCVTYWLTHRGHLQAFAGRDHSIRPVIVRPRTLPKCLVPFAADAVLH